MLDVLIQTHNEALNLPHVLESLRGLTRQVFVVDSGSTDGTRQVAEAFGATFVEHPWEGYAAQKNWALDNLPFTAPWVLILDADESLTPELREEIREVTHRPVGDVQESGFYLNRVFVFMGRKIWHCGYFPSWNLRLFKRGHARYENRTVHEHMTVTGPTGYLRHLILHEDRRGLEHFIAKHNRYSTLEAEELYEVPAEWPGLGRFLADRIARRRFLKLRVLPNLPVPGAWRMFYMYVLQLGFLDGRPGFSLCLFISTYEMFIRAKYIELNRQKGQVATEVRGLSLPEGSRPPISPAAASAVVAVPAVAAPHQQDEIGSPLPVAAPVPARPVPVSAERKTRVSVMIPTLNEAANLPRCLDHLRWADEVVVVDSGSKDQTRAIAEAYGARVVQFKWDGRWPKKKNWALRNVDFRNEWVLIVDADEWITPELADEISGELQRVENPTVGYYVNRRFIFMGGWIRHCGYYPSWNLRLIRRGHGEYEQLTDIGNTGSGDNEVHEHIVATGPVRHLRHDMLHFAFPSINVFMEKHNRYSNWEAAVQFRGADEPADAVPGNQDLSRRRWLKNLSRRFPFRPTLRFLYSYVWKAGFLDGRPGYVFCRLLAIYEYLSVAKYYELRRADQDLRTSQRLSAVPPTNLWKPDPPAAATQGAR